MQAQDAPNFIEQLKALRGSDEPEFVRAAELMCAALGGLAMLQEQEDEQLQEKIRGLWLEGQRQLAEAAAARLSALPQPKATMPHLGGARGERESMSELSNQLAQFAMQLQDVLPDGLDPRTRRAKDV